MASKKVTLEALAALITKTSATTDKKFTALADDIAGVEGEIADLKNEMMDQFEHVNKEFRVTDDRLRDISSEIAVIHLHIERLEEQGASNAGFAKEIDHLLTRVAEIERHLGLNEKIAA